MLVTARDILISDISGTTTEQRAQMKEVCVGWLGGWGVFSFKPRNALSDCWGRGGLAGVGRRIPPHKAWRVGGVSTSQPAAVLIPSPHTHTP